MATYTVAEIFGEPSVEFHVIQVEGVVRVRTTFTQSTMRITRLRTRDEREQGRIIRLERFNWKWISYSV